MKNTAHLRRFFIASLIISFTVPMVYHTVSNYMRREYYSNLTREVCKAVEPQVQMGSFRQPIEYAQGMMLRQGFDYTPAVAFFDHGTEITPHHQSKIGDVRIDCEFAGFPNVRMSIFYEMAPLLNFQYVYIYLACLPIFFAIFSLIRVLLNRFQRQVVDVVQAQIKHLMDLDGSDEKPKGLIGRLLDLNIPLLGYLKDHIDGLEDRLAEYSKKIADQKKAEILSDVAAQVAHDIVAPIATLQKILTTSSGDPAKDRALIHEELERVKALAEKMLRQYRGEAAFEKSERFSVSALFSNALAEANALAAGRCEIVSDFPSEDLYVEGVKSDLASAISNVVKNAIESIDKATGQVRIQMKRDGHLVKILVEDTGCGIPIENIDRVFEKDVSYKRGGTGLGLFQAHSAVTAMGGKITLRSKVGAGTAVEIGLPLATEAVNLVVNIPTDTHLAFVDDQNLIHEVWRSLLPSELPPERIHFFSTGEEFYSWRESNREKNSISFIDHDLSADGETGIDLIERCQCRESSFLLTGRAAEESVKGRAREKGIRLIDKAQQGQIRFNLEGSGAEIVLIDDARANRIAWSARARQEGQSIETFESAEAFFIAESKFSRKTPIYVDYLFDGAAIGGVIAERILKAGFTNVFLATAYPKEKVSAPVGIRGVVGKEFPNDLAGGRSELSQI